VVLLEGLDVAAGVAVDPVVVVLPHAASSTRAINASREKQARDGADEDELRHLSSSAYAEELHLAFRRYSRCSRSVRT